MNSDMWRGVEHEPFARDHYSGHYQQAVECGFMRREEDGWTLGLSPDGLVGTNGGVEIKCPRAKTHVAWTLADKVPAQHMAQVQAALLVSGREWWDFASYCGGLPLFVKRVTPDPAWHEAIIAAVKACELAVDLIVGDYDRATRGLPATERIDLSDLGLVF
jgi:predicted phage-related endonuclease